MRVVHWLYLGVALVVLAVSSSGGFRTAAGFPWVFGGAWLLVGLGLRWRAGRRALPVRILTLGLIAAAAIPLGQLGWMRWTMGRAEAAALARLEGRAVAALEFDRVIPEGALSELDLERSVVVLNFWATWCSPCVKEMPQLEAFAAAHADSSIRVIGLTRLYETEAGEDPEPELRRIEAFLADRGVTYPIAVSGSGDLHEAFEVTGLPTTVLVDRGTIRAYGIGLAGAKRVMKAAAERGG